MSLPKRRQRIYLASTSTHIPQSHVASTSTHVPQSHVDYYRHQKKSWLFGGWAGNDKGAIMSKPEDENKGFLGSIGKFFAGDDMFSDRARSKEQSGKDVNPPSRKGNDIRNLFQPLFFGGKPKPQEQQSGAIIQKEGEGVTRKRGGLWKDWKKMTLDVYLRLRDKPSTSRIKIKQTLSILPFLKLKPMIELGLPDHKQGALQNARLDIKAFNCFKYQLYPDGRSAIQVRVKAPLNDPNFTIDVKYMRDLNRGKDSVGITLRGWEFLFLKAPRFGAGFKIPVRFEGGVKSTLLTKKYLFQEENTEQTHRRRKSMIFERKRGYQPQQRRSKRHILNNLGVEGPSGLDIKIRCLEYQ